MCDECYEHDLSRKGINKKSSIMRNRAWYQNITYIFPFYLRNCSILSWGKKWPKNTHSIFWDMGRRAAGGSVGQWGKEIHMTGEQGETRNERTENTS